MFGFSQCEVGMFRICRKKIAELEAGKAEPARLQLAQEATAWSVDFVGCSPSWETVRVIFFLIRKL